MKIREYNCLMTQNGGANNSPPGCDDEFFVSLISLGESNSDGFLRRFYYYTLRSLTAAQQALEMFISIDVTIKLRRVSPIAALYLLPS